MSVVIARPPSAIFREEQNFAWWVYAAVGCFAVLAAAGFKLPWSWRTPTAPLPFRWPTLEGPIYLTLGLGLPLMLVVGLLRMTTEVTTGCCCVSFGWVPTYRRMIALSEVTRIEIVRYRALREHGFWGVRTTRDGERVLTARGDQAVRLFLSDGSRILIGTQRADDLAATIKSEMKV